jgi:hypothetical protein
MWTWEMKVAPYLQGTPIETVRKRFAGTPRERVANVYRVMRGAFNRGLDVATGRTTAVPNALQ